MKVAAIYRNDPERLLYDPLPEKPGIVFRIMRGDLVWAAGGNWLKQPYHPLVVRWLDFPIPLPFLAWRVQWSDVAIIVALIVCAAGLWWMQWWLFAIMSTLGFVAAFLPRRYEWTGYVGAKVFVLNGASTPPGLFEYPQYLAILPMDDLMPGSMAMQPSIRPFAKPE